jgi:competence protein ComEC
VSRVAFWIIIAGFFVGVLWRSFFDWGISVTACVFLCAACFLLYGALTRKIIVLTATLALCAVGVGMARVAISDMQNRADIQLEQVVGTSTILEGVVRGEPDERDTHTQVVVQVQTLGEEKVPIADRVLIYAPHYPQLRYGDQVEIAGTLKYPEVIQEEDGRVFLYPAYLKKDGIHFVISYPKVTVRAHETGWSVRGTLFSLKQQFLDALKAVLPEPQVSLLGGLVVGAKEALGKDLLDTFRAAGVVHIVVLSGYNVSIIARYVTRLLSPLPRAFGWGMGSALIVVFAMLTGGSATIVRASIMALLVFVAQVAGRKFDALRALFAAAFVMILHNPYILAFDPSFQLSFLATFGLIAYAPLFEKWFSSFPNMFGMREILAATFATELFVLPFLLWMSGTFSIVAPLTNVLVLWTVPFTMGIGFVVGCIALVSVAVAYPFAGIAHGILSYQLWVIERAAEVPFASVHVPPLSLWLIAIAYGALMLGAYRIVSKSPPS